MKKIYFIAFFCLFFSTYTFATDKAVEIVSKMDALMRGKSSFGKYTIISQTPRWTRTMKMDSWSLGTAKAFIKINYPLKDQGTTFLKIKTDFWQYVPKIEKVIKFPPSMMLQSWMGTDFTNDDLVKESSIIEDYTHKLIQENHDTYTIESIPKPNAAIIWGKIVQIIDKKAYYPIKIEYYDEDNNLMRVLNYSNVTKLSDRYFPMTWTMLPQAEDKKGNSTIVQIEQIEFNKEIPDIFTLKALKDMSR